MYPVDTIGDLAPSSSSSLTRETKIALVGIVAAAALQTLPTYRKWEGKSRVRRFGGSVAVGLAFAGLVYLATKPKA